MPATGYTASELAKLTGKTRHAVESWLSDHKIKPLSYEAIYPSEILDRLKEARRGRPVKKPATADPSPEPSKKPRKQS